MFPLQAVDRRQRLRCTVRGDACLDAVRVAPIGELDVATVSTLEHAIDEAERSDPLIVIVDLRGLTFIDGTGLGLLRRVDAARRAMGRGLALIQGGAPVRRLFELTGAENTLAFVDPVPSLGHSVRRVA